MSASTLLPGPRAETERAGSDSRDQLRVCTVCDGRDLVRPYPVELPWLTRCRGCGLMMVDPQPSDEELADIYDGEYFRAFGCDEHGELAYRAVKQATAQRLLTSAERVWAPARLLDVGSGPGDMLAVARRRGWSVAGIEPNKFAVDRTADLVPEAEVFCGTLEQFEARDDPFDLVTCLEVIEHLPRPDLGLSTIYDSLRPGGGLVITTPDIASLHARISGRRWVHFHRDHLWYFNRSTLCRLVHSAGFEVVCCRTACKVFNLKYILEIFSRFSGSPVVRRIAETGLRWMPQRVLRMRLPPLPEGLLLVARKPAAPTAARSRQLPGMFSRRGKRKRSPW